MKIRTTFTSMRQCSEETGYHMHLLKLAKKHPESEGFFNNGKVNWNKAAPFIEEYWEELNNEYKESLPHWNCKIEKAKAEKAELLLEVARGHLVLTEDIYRTCLAVALGQRAMLLSALRDDYPSKLLGLNETQMSVELNKLVETLVEQWNPIKEKLKQSV